MKLTSALMPKVGSSNVKAALLSQVTYQDPYYDGFRRLGADAEQKNQLVYNTDRMREICFQLWRLNDFAQWIVDIQTAFVVGDGFTYEANEDDIYEVIDDFWTHSANDLNCYVEQHYKELMVYGTLLLTKNVSEFMGDVYLGYIDPVLIDSILTDPENVKLRIAVVLKKVNDVQRTYKVVMDKQMESVLSEKAVAIREAMTHGEVYLLTINNVTNEAEGISDLYNLADKFQVLEMFLADYGAKLPQLNSFIWDVKVEGADSEELAGYENNFNRKPGSSFFHNESVEMVAVTPDLKSSDADEAARVLRTPMMGKFSIPRHFYGDPQGTNRATSIEAGSPFYKLMNSKQRIYRKFWEFVVSDMLETKVDSGELRVDDMSFQLIAPELSKRDLEGLSSTVNQMITSVLGSMHAGIIDEKTARSMVAFVYEFIGYEMDVDKVEEMLAEEKAGEMERDFQNDQAMADVVPLRDAGDNK